MKIYHLLTTLLTFSIPVKVVIKKALLKLVIRQ